MKFHNQRSFMGHEISNVNNKPLLHKKGKQWIVVAVSALILAGFGGMVSMTTHADTTTQPATTKVAPKPANTPANVMKQAQGMHKALTNNAVTQKGAPSSVVAKKTAPASAASTTSAKSSSASSNSNSLNNKATKPSVHMMLMTPTPTKPKGDNLAPQGVSQTDTGKWNNNTGSATWNLYANGQLDLHDGTVTGGWPSNLNRNSVKYFNTSNITNSNNLPFGNASAWNIFSGDNAIKDINLSGLPKNWKVSGNWGHGFCDIPNVSDINLGQPDTSGNNYFDTMFANDTSLKSIEGLQYFNTNSTTNMSNMFYNCPQLKSLDLSSFNSTHVNNNQPDYINGGNHSGNYDIFKGDTNLSSIKLGINDRFEPDSGISPYAFTSNANLLTSTPTKLDDDQSHTNNGHPWKIYQHGNWGSANWYLNNGTLLVIGNTITNDPNNHGINWSNVNSIVTRDVSAPNNSLSGSFANIPHVTSIDLSGIQNVSAITNMSNLFQNDSDLTDINLGNNFNTSNVTDMSGMFQNDRKLPSINFGNEFNTAKVNDMGWMFAGDWHLTNLTLPNNFSTNNTNTSFIFDSDTALNQLSLPSGFQNTKNNNLFGSGGTVPLYEITLQPNTELGSSSSLPNDTWTNLNNHTLTKSTSQLVSNNAGTWLRTAPETINYTWWNQAFQGKVYSLYGSSITINNNSDAHKYGLPSGWSLIQPASFTITNNGGTYTINDLEPTVNYMYNNHLISTNNINPGSPGNAQSFTVTNANGNLPSGYQLKNNPISVPFVGNHDVNIIPAQEIDTIHYTYKNNTLKSQQFNGLNSVTDNNNGFNVNSTNDPGIPDGYQLANKNNIFKYDGNIHNVAVTPIQKKDTIDYIANYPNGSTLVSSASSTGNDYQAQNASDTQFTVTSAPANYQLVPNENTTFNYDSSNHDVAVEPAQNNQKTDVINYMNGDVKVASDVYTGNDMYAPNANHMSFNANDYVPAGYHVVNDGDNTFYFDGQTHDVTVYPNSITLEFNNGQAGSKTINNLKGTTYQINSSDVPANYQLTNPNDDVIDLDNLGKSTEYNVDVSPIQQSVMPSDNIQPAPYVPSTPISVASSASSTSSESAAPASASNTTSQPSNEAKPSYRSHYSHYRYAKVITPLQLHTSKHFTDKNGVLVIKHPTEFRIMKIVHDHKYTRYEVKYQGHKYFITGNSKFTINDYVQKSDFKSRKHMMVRVITPLIEYKRSHFSKKYAIKVFKKGAVLSVKRVLPFGRGEMTRFQLTNGRYVTSNKLFVKVIK